MAVDYDETGEIRKQREHDREEALKKLEQNNFKEKQREADTVRLKEIEKERKDLQDKLKSNPNGDSIKKNLALLNEEEKIILKRNTHENQKRKFKDLLHKKLPAGNRHGSAIASNAGRLLADPHLQPADVLRATGSIIGHTALLATKPSISKLLEKDNKSRRDENTPLTRMSTFFRKGRRN